MAVEALAVRLGADVSEVTRAFDRVVREMDRVATRLSAIAAAAPEITVEAEVTEAVRELETIQAAAERLGDQQLELAMEVDAAGVVESFEEAAGAATRVPEAVEQAAARVQRTDVGAPIATSVERAVSSAERSLDRLRAAASDLAGVGRTASIGLTAPLAALGGIALVAAGNIEDAYATIRAGTGATGDALASLRDDFQAVFSRVPQMAGAVGVAIADLNTRTGRTGTALQDLSVQMLNLSRLTGTELGGAIRLATRLFGDWGIAVEDQSATLDTLFRATQMTGAGFDTLTAKMVQFGAPLRQMGFSMGQAAAMMGKWEQEGVNTELVLGSLRIALLNFAKAGLEPVDAFRSLIQTMQQLDDAAAIDLAKQVFGARAAADMAAAIREGRFEFEALFAAIEGGSDTINQAAADTLTFAQQFAMLRNQAAAAFAPLGTVLQEAIASVQPAISGAIELVGRLVRGFAELPAPLRNAALAVAGIAMAAGPVIIALAGIITSLAAVGKAFVAIKAAGSLKLLLAPLALMAVKVIAVVGAIGLLVAAVYRFRSEITTVMQVVTRVTRDAWDWFSRLAQGIGGTFSGVAAKVYASLRGVGESVRAALEPVAALGAHIAAALAPMAEVAARIGRAFQTLALIVIGITAAIVGGLAMAAVALGRGLLGAVGSAVRAFRDAWRSVTRVVRAEAQRVAAAALEVVLALRAGILSVGRVVVAGVQQLWGAVSASVQGLYSVLRTAAARALEGVMQVFAPVARRIQAALAPVTSWLAQWPPFFRDIGRRVVDGLISGILAQLRRIPGIGQAVVDRIEASLGGARTYLLGAHMVEQVAEGISGAVPTAEAAAAGAMDRIRSALTGLLPAGEEFSLDLNTGRAETEIERMQRRVQTLTSLIELLRARGESAAPHLEQLFQIERRIDEQLRTRAALRAEDLAALLQMSQAVRQIRLPDLTLDTRQVQEEFAKLRRLASQVSLVSLTADLSVDPALRALRRFQHRLAEASRAGRTDLAALRSAFVEFQSAVGELPVAPRLDLSPLEQAIVRAERQAAAAGLRLSVAAEVEDVLPLLGEVEQAVEAADLTLQIGAGLQDAAPALAELRRQIEALQLGVPVELEGVRESIRRARRIMVQAAPTLEVQLALAPVMGTLAELDRALSRAEPTVEVRARLAALRPLLEEAREAVRSFDLPLPARVEIEPLRPLLAALAEDARRAAIGIPVDLVGAAERMRELHGLLRREELTADVEVVLGMPTGALAELRREVEAAAPMVEIAAEVVGAQEALAQVTRQIAALDPTLTIEANTGEALRQVAHLEEMMGALAAEVPVSLADVESQIAELAALLSRQDLALEVRSLIEPLHQRLRSLAAQVRRTMPTLQIGVQLEELDPVLREAEDLLRRTPLTAAIGAELADLAPVLGALRSQLEDARVGVPVEPTLLTEALAHVRAALAREDLSLEVRTVMTDFAERLAELEQAAREAGAMVQIGVEMPDPAEIARRAEELVRRVDPVIAARLDLAAATDAADRFVADLSRLALTTELHVQLPDILPLVRRMASELARVPLGIGLPTDELAGDVEALIEMIQSADLSPEVRLSLEPVLAWLRETEALLRRELPVFPVALDLRLGGLDPAAIRSIQASLRAAVPTDASRELAARLEAAGLSAGRELRAAGGVIGANALLLERAAANARDATFVAHQAMRFAVPDPRPWELALDRLAGQTHAVAAQLGAAAAVAGPFAPALTLASEAARWFGERLDAVDAGRINAAIGGIEAVAPALMTAVGGIAGALVSVGGAMHQVGAKLFSVLSPLSILGAVIDQIARNLAPTFDVLEAPLKEIANIAASILVPILRGLSPIIEAIGRLFEDLGPLIQAVMEVITPLLSALMPILKALVPILVALFPVFRELAVIVTYWGQAVAAVAAVVVRIAGALAVAVGANIAAIGRLLSRIPGLGAFGRSVEIVGEAIRDVGRGLNGLSDALWEAFDAFGEARRAIREVRVADELERVADAAKEVAESLRNVPTGFKRLLDQIRYDVQEPLLVATRAVVEPPPRPREKEGPVMPPAPGAPPVAPVIINFAEGAIQVQEVRGDPRATAREVKAEFERMGLVQLGRREDWTEVIGPTS